MRRAKRIAVLLLLGFWLWPAGLWGQDLLEPVGNGAVNWSRGIIQATGIGAPPESAYGKPQARPLALRAAKLDALRNMLEVVKGVRIDSTSVVKNFEIQSDVIMSKVEGMVRGARQVKQEYMSDGTVEVVMEMDLHGDFAQLTLPADIRQVETIKPISPAAPAPETTYTGLVVDARGLGARPAMAPKVLDEQGQEIYGSAFVSREYAVQQGVAGYAKNISAAEASERVAGQPFTVKALRTTGPGRCDLVIPNVDAAKLRNLSEHLAFLKKCRVMIVVD